jgi:hypothetical protein
MADSIEQLGYELTSSALAEQERALSRLRTCAGTVLAAASIAGSFLGARTNGGVLDVWGILALSAYALCLGCAVWVLLPRHFVFAFRGGALVAADEQSHRLDLTTAYRVAGGWIEPHLHVNRRKLIYLSRWLTASCGLLAAEVILWTVSLTS